MQHPNTYTFVEKKSKLLLAVVRFFIKFSFFWPYVGHYAYWIRSQTERMTSKLDLKGEIFPRLKELRNDFEGKKNQLTDLHQLWFVRFWLYWSFFSLFWPNLSVFGIIDIVMRLLTSGEFRCWRGNASHSFTHSSVSCSTYFVLHLLIRDTNSTFSAFTDVKKYGFIFRARKYLFFSLVIHSLVRNMNFVCIRISRLLRNYRLSLSLSLTLLHSVLRRFIAYKRSSWLHQQMLFLAANLFRED